MGVISRDIAVLSVKRKTPAIPGLGTLKSGPESDINLHAWPLTLTDDVRYRKQKYLAAT